MDAVIREYRPHDGEAIVALSLRAWAPVFASLERALGDEVFARLHPDWRHDQATAVRATLGDAGTHTWVAEDNRRVLGFVAAAIDRDRGLGEISMLAVDPGDQRRGVGSALTEVATEWLRGAGARVAMVETGGDSGHAPGAACVRAGRLRAVADRPILQSAVSHAERRRPGSVGAGPGVAALTSFIVNWELTRVTPGSSASLFM